MTDNELKDTVIRLAEPTVRALGLMIWGVEVGRAGRTHIRLFVDTVAGRQNISTDQVSLDLAAPPIDTLVDLAAPEHDTEVAAIAATASASISQCQEISRRLGLALEVEDCLEDAYVLEVSTPGLSRIFFTVEQMCPYVGDIVEVRLLVPTAPEGHDTAANRRRTWRGKLMAVEDTTFVFEPVTVSVDGEVTPENLPPVRVAWEAVRRASRMYIFRAPVKPGKSKTGAKATGKAGAASLVKGAKAAKAARVAKAEKIAMQAALGPALEEDT